MIGTLLIAQLLASLADPALSQQGEKAMAEEATPRHPPTPDEIPFRLLSQADFLATHPPRESAGHPAGVHAISCLRIGWPAGYPIEISTRGKRVSAVARTPSFIALFDRKCSWWSPDPEDSSYALLHEQVHFAIAEYAARMLTQEEHGKHRVIRAFGSTPDRALADLEESLRLLASRARWAARREHDAFDAETRRDRSPELQQRWVQLYEERLGIRLSPSAP